MERMNTLNIEKFTKEAHLKYLSNEFFNINSSLKKYIMGVTTEGDIHTLANTVDADGFIDDFTNEISFFGKPILRSIDISQDSIIVVSSTVRTLTAHKSLEKVGFTNIITYPALFRYREEDNLPIKLIKEFDKEFMKNKNKYEVIYGKLHDNISREIFVDLLNYRATCKLKYLNSFFFDPIGQYFEDFLNLQEDEVFIDVGGYDGQTSIEFVKHCPNYKAVYIFEPEEKNVELAKTNLAVHPNIHIFSTGLSNKKDILKFKMGLGSASILSEDGECDIEVDTLDNLVKEKVTFIKMDIEGAEGLAIDGMKNHILNDHPKMAISVYHKVDDFWKISEQVLTIRNDYDLYMRHYTEGTDETVMFFIPQLKVYHAN